MKKFSLALLAAAAALAITPAALANSLCPNQAGQGGDGSGTFTSVAGPLDGTSCGASNTAVTMSIPNQTDYIRLAWTPGNTGYPAGLTLGNLGGVTASVAFTAGTDQPYYMLIFTDPSDSLGQTASTDQILMLEFQPSTLSGPGDDTLALNPTTTQFNLFDNTTGKYLEGGQAHTNSLDGWLLLDQGLSNEDIEQIRLAMGLAGGSGPGESLTVDSADITETPEPGSLLLLGTGMLGLAFVAFRKVRSSGRAPLSLPS